MKLWSSYIKELKIASRGFYFYVELFMAIVLLIILLVFVQENPVSKEKEFIYYNVPELIKQIEMHREITAGRMKLTEPVKLTLKAVKFEITDEKTGEALSFYYDEEKIITVDTAEIINPESGKLEKTLFMMENKEDLMRAALSEKSMGAEIRTDLSGTVYFTYYLQGYETERMVNLLYIISDNSSDRLLQQIEQQNIRTLSDEEILNNRQNLLPLFIVFTGSLMGFFIVMAYIFLDKDEGVIKAYAVTPSSLWTYLLSKIGIIVTTVVISASIITLPVMGLSINYFPFYVFLILTNFTFAVLGLLIASFYDSIDKAFGVLYLVMIILMIPVFPYIIPSFDPVILRFFPTYSILNGFRDILLNKDMTYVWIYSLVYLISGFLLLLIAKYRFKKTLTV